MKSIRTTATIRPLYCANGLPLTCAVMYAAPASKGMLDSLFKYFNLIHLFVKGQITITAKDDGTFVITLQGAAMQTVFFSRILTMTNDLAQTVLLSWPSVIEVIYGLVGHSNLFSRQRLFTTSRRRFATSSLHTLDTLYMSKNAISRS